LDYIRTYFFCCVHETVLVIAKIIYGCHYWTISDHHPS
jgi:hypothetical protein